jgi:hypothetical protein
MATACDATLPTHHKGWAFTAWYI